jgi:hypothetical protein
MLSDHLAACFHNGGFASRENRFEFIVSWDDNDLGHQAECTGSAGRSHCTLTSIPPIGAKRRISNFAPWLQCHKRFDEFAPDRIDAGLWPVEGIGQPMEFPTILRLVNEACRTSPCAIFGTEPWGVFLLGVERHQVPSMWRGCRGRNFV